MPDRVDWITPDWPVPARVRAVCTTRRGGVSSGPYQSMNPADHVGDDATAVVANRAQLQQALRLSAAPCWLQQVHGTRVIEAASPSPAGAAPRADAAWSAQAGVACVVMTADCLPLLLTDEGGQCVAAVHAGWRGLAAGVIERTVAAMPMPGETLLAWLGPAIGPDAYEVGAEVRNTFISHASAAADAFRPNGAGHWLLDMYQLARQRLAGCGVRAVYGGQWCSYSDPGRFFSYRRDGVTGRMAALIWLQQG